MTDPTFTLFWRDGKREIVRGRNVAEAMTLAGYGGGAMRALDFWANGDSADWTWDAAGRTWISMPPSLVSAPNGDGP